VDEVIKAVRAYEHREVDKHFGDDSILHDLYDCADREGQRLADILKADKYITALGTSLMDISLGEAKSLGKIDEHVDIGEKAAKVFLAKHEVGDEITKRVVECIREHHGADPFSSLESEICANADCYKFLIPENVESFMKELRKREMTDEEAKSYAKEKVEEKWNTLSLEICKKELGENYKILKRIL